MGTVLSDKADELLRLGNLRGIVPTISIPQRETAIDTIFTEGKRVAKYHLMIERNRSLRKEFFKRLRPPYLCDVCGDKVNQHYPWTENLLQVHHVLPLSSPVKTTMAGTTFSDLVSVCPNCHNAIHSYYRKWLTAHKQEDFSTDSEAKSVYKEVKVEYRA
jgi:predicted HNH restriction endonuclease